MPPACHHARPCDACIHRGMQQRAVASPLLPSCSQVGEAMLAALPAETPAAAAAYRTPGLGLSDLLNELCSAGLLGVGSVPGKRAGTSPPVFHYSARLNWLQPYGRRSAAAAPPAAPPLPTRPVPAERAAPAAAAAVEVTINPPPALGKERVSRANAVNILKSRLGRTLQGGPRCFAGLHAPLPALDAPPLAQPHPSAAAPAGSSPAATQLLQLVVACLLSEGLQKVDALHFRQNLVSLKAARKAFEQQLRCKGHALQACYRDQFGGSLLQLLRAPPLAALVQLHGMSAPAGNGWQPAGCGEQGPGAAAAAHATAPLYTDRWWGAASAQRTAGRCSPSHPSCLG